MYLRNLIERASHGSRNKTVNCIAAERWLSRNAGHLCSANVTVLGDDLYCHAFLFHTSWICVTSSVAACGPKWPSAGRSSATCKASRVTCTLRVGRRSSVSCSRSWSARALATTSPHQAHLMLRHCVHQGRDAPATARHVRLSSAATPSYSRRHAVSLSRQVTHCLADTPACLTGRQLSQPAGYIWSSCAIV